MTPITLHLSGCTHAEAMARIAEFLETIDRDVTRRAETEIALAAEDLAIEELEVWSEVLEVWSAGSEARLDGVLAQVREVLGHVAPAEIAEVHVTGFPRLA